MKVGSGVSITDASILAVSAGTEIPASIYIDWTLTLTVRNQVGSLVNGATVIYTDRLSHAQCTAITNSFGTASCVLTEYRLNNDTGANHAIYGIIIRPVFVGATRKMMTLLGKKLRCQNLTA